MGGQMTTNRGSNSLSHSSNENLYYGDDECETNTYTQSATMESSSSFCSTTIESESGNEESGTDYSECDEDSGSDEDEDDEENEDSSSDEYTTSDEKSVSTSTDGTTKSIETTDITATTLGSIVLTKEKSNNKRITKKTHGNNNSTSPSSNGSSSSTSISSKVEDSQATSWCVSDLHNITGDDDFDGRLIRLNESDEIWARAVHGFRALEMAQKLSELSVEDSNATESRA